MDKRVITTEAMEEDLRLEGSLRPQSLSEYIGQEKTKKDVENIYRGSQAKRRCLRSRTVLWPSWSGKDDVGRNHCQRDGCAHEGHFRAGD